MPKLSIIIPVYNVEKYLERCLDSVLNQTFDDIEIICVNDCSTDNSLNILNKYKNKDKRLKIINLLQNQGVSYARNMGMEFASGDYIAFLDSDDSWKSNLAETTLNAITKNSFDIVIFGHNLYKNGTYYPDKQKNESIKACIENGICKKSNNHFVNVVWDKIYKVNFLKNNLIKFDTQLTQAEDVLFSLESLSKSPKIIFLEDFLYNYSIDREGSAMYDNTNIVSNQIKAFKKMIKSNFFNQSKVDFKNYSVNIFLGGIIYFYVLTAKRKFNLYNFIEMKKLSSFLENNFSRDFLSQNKEYITLKEMTGINLKKGVSILK